MSAPISLPDLPKSQIQGGTEEEVGFADCDCCGFREECTAAYVERVRRIFAGRWICGLCAEAVEDEVHRSNPRRITTDEALRQHTAFCRSHRSSPSAAAAAANEHLIAAVMQLLRRSLDSPRATRSAPISPGEQSPSSSLARSDSCFPTLAG